MNNTKSSIRHTNEYIQSISRCRNLKKPLLKFYQFYCESDKIFQKLKEWRFIKRFRPTLNGELQEIVMGH